MLFTNIVDLDKEFSKSELGKVAKIVGLGARIIDILMYFPVRYNKYFESTILDSHLVGSDVTLQVRVVKHIKSLHFKGRKTPYRIACIGQNDQSVMLNFFYYNKTYLDKYETGKVAKIRGKLSLYKGNYSISHPNLTKVSNEFLPIEQEQYEILPKYRLVDGVTQKDMAQIMQKCLELAKSEDCRIDKIDQNFSQNTTFMSLLEAIHSPKNEAVLSDALKYFAFEEFVASMLASRLARVEVVQSSGIAISDKQVLQHKVLANFGHELTNDQVVVLEKIVNSRLSGVNKPVLIQGDVGSGKTIVAILAACGVIEAKYSCIFLAPTTILAMQHFQCANDLFYGLGVVCEIITGKTPAAKRRRIIDDFRSGKIDVLFGTHALFNDEIISDKIGLIIIDEQHRFGVEQRISLINKSRAAGVIMMSATPIPRTIAMAMYGDIDTYTIRQKPHFQKPVITTVMSMDKYDEILRNISRQIAENNKVYWVCHLIDDEEGDSGVMQRFADIKARFGNESALLIHGKMSESDKNAIIHEFQNSNKNILVSTTVIEVGVNIPNATIMIIEDANKFGLSQLHQLRGRVGRGEKQSYCVLLYGCKNDDPSLERLRVIRNCNDGFEIATEDMKMRGTGSILGIEQSGDAGYKIANLQRDFKIMQYALDFVEKNTEIMNINNPNYHRILQTFFPFEYTKYLKA